MNMKWYKYTSLKSAGPIVIPFILLLLFSCSSGEDDPDIAGLNSVGFDINISGNFSRNMQGTNATFKLLQMPGSFVTTHQLSIYLVDGEGYSVIASILINGAAVPSTGTYPINNLLSSSLKENDGSLLFGQNGGISYSSAAGSGGSITLTQTGSDFIKGTIDGGLIATGTGSGSINIKGAFFAQLAD